MERRELEMDVGTKHHGACVSFPKKQAKHSPLKTVAVLSELQSFPFRSAGGRCSGQVDVLSKSKRIASIHCNTTA